MDSQKMRVGHFFSFLAWLTLLLCSSFLLTSAKKEAVARKGDVIYIKCGVCEEIAKHIARQVRKRKEEVSPRKVTELQVIEIVEKICDPKREEGDWIQWLDIVKDGTKLKLEEQEGPGECKGKCKTIQRACEEVLGEHDTDVAEAVHNKDMGRAALTNLLCRRLSNACVRSTPPVPEDWQPVEAFERKPSDKIEAEKIQRKMQDFPGGPKMKLYSRDELMKKTVFTGREDEEEEEEDEDIQSLLKEDAEAMGFSPDEL
eukprot:TRINITY_DN4567_c0_g2_i1.p1 TRINITY_DN4567_c0_g2~~TRINITY_DN4567_c0_g2_i1.p1  ORF type:complete len:258 (+),score=53.83 TRINITY_DN4567_c0_g2_i1:169-942(+)